MYAVRGVNVKVVLQMRLRQDENGLYAKLFILKRTRGDDAIHSQEVVIPWLGA